MDLALHLGMPATTLAATMTERELRQWERYAARRMLPQRRIELYLAQIAHVVARVMGGAKDLTLADFLLDPPEDDDDGDQASAEEAAAFFGFAPRNLHKKDA